MMNVAQRRGKGPENLKNQTVLVPEEDCNNDASLLLHVPTNGTVTTTTTNTTTSSAGLPVITNNSNSNFPSMNMMTVVAMGSGGGGGGDGSATTTTNVTATTGNCCTVAVAAKVRRRYCGTGPFDHQWLNLDCCGLFCAIITYLLHIYAIYTVLFILIPPWMNIDVIDPINSTVQLATNIRNNVTTNLIGNDKLNMIQRQIMMGSTTTTITTITEHSVSWIGVVHRVVFTGIAILAIVSHWYAMTTDPGSVPPDAQPVLAVTTTTTTTTTTTENTTDNNNSNEKKSLSLDNNNINSDGNNNNNNHHQSAIQNYLLEPPPSPSRMNTNAAVKRICRRCKSYKPHRAHHCSICQRCIIKMDHHCPWINNCVGIGNHKYFLLFIFYTSLSCLYSLLLIIIRFTSCSNHGMINYQNHHGQHHHHQKLFRLRHPEQFGNNNFTPTTTTTSQHCLDRPTHLLYILALLVEAILFGLFTACMMMDQMDVVRSKVTHIDRYKGSDDSIGSHTMAGVLEVFGSAATATGTTWRHRTNTNVNTKRNNNNHNRWSLLDRRFRWDWLSPFVPVCFPSITVRDEVIGFCRPCGFPSSHINNYPKRDNSNMAVPLQSSFAKTVTTTSSKGSKIVNHKSSMVEII